MNFDELKNKAAGVLGTMAGAASRAARAARTSVSICAEEDKVRTAYQALGKLYYRDSKAGAAPSGPEYDREVEKIEAAFARIRELRNQDSVAPEEKAPEDDDLEEITEEPAETKE